MNRRTRRRVEQPQPPWRKRRLLARACGPSEWPASRRVKPVRRGTTCSRQGQPIGCGFVAAGPGQTLGSGAVCRPTSATSDVQNRTSTAPKPPSFRWNERGSAVTVSRWAEREHTLTARSLTSASQHGGERQKTGTLPKRVTAVDAVSVLGAHRYEVVLLHAQLFCLEPIDVEEAASSKPSRQGCSQHVSVNAGWTRLVEVDVQHARVGTSI